MATTNLRPINSLVNRLMTIFHAAQKSDLQDLQADLESVDIGADQWNSNYRQPSASEIPVSPNEFMGGATGAEKMSGHWSTKTPNDTSPTALLGQMVSRMETLEKSMIAMASVIHLLCKSDDEDDKAKKSDSDEDDSDEDEDEESAKSGIQKLSVADMMSTIGGRLTKKAAEAREAENARNTISTPPSMHPAISKANSRSLRTIVSDTINTGVRSNSNPVSQGEEICFRQLHNALSHVEAGNAGAMTMVERLRGQLGV
jgi:hypothetical protein